MFETFYRCKILYRMLYIKLSMKSYYKQRWIIQVVGTYLCTVSHTHLQRLVHRRFAFLLLRLPLQAVWQPHAIILWHVFSLSASVEYMIFQLTSLCNICSKRLPKNRISYLRKNILLNAYLLTLKEFSNCSTRPRLTCGYTVLWWILCSTTFTWNFFPKNWTLKK